MEGIHGFHSFRATAAGNMANRLPPSRQWIQSCGVWRALQLVILAKLVIVSALLVGEFVKRVVDILLTDPALAERFVITDELHRNEPGIDLFAVLVVLPPRTDQNVN